MYWRDFRLKVSLYFSPTNWNSNKCNQNLNNTKYVCNYYINMIRTSYVYIKKVCHKVRFPTTKLICTYVLQMMSGFRYHI